MIRAHINPISGALLMSSALYITGCAADVHAPAEGERAAPRFELSSDAGHFAYDASMDESSEGVMRRESHGDSD